MKYAHLYFLVLFFSFFECAFASAELINQLSIWETQAKKLGFENPEMNLALEQLKKIKTVDLVFELRNSIQDHKLENLETYELALLVIRSLELNALVLDLLKLSKDYPSTSIFKTINSIVMPNNEQILFFHYSQILKESEAVSPPIVITLLSGLTKVRSFLDQSTLLFLISNPSFEVRLATLDYISKRLQETNYKDLKNFELTLKKTLTSHPYQVRLMTLDIIEAMPVDKKQTFSNVLSLCKNDVNVEVRNSCQKLQGSK
jgi:hypothetical protein